MNCSGCGNKVTDDGHGERIHVIAGPVVSYRYGCKPADKITAREADYPVAS